MNVRGSDIDTELYHHGILGQKWGVRRYQNEDGTLTSAGKARYSKKEYRSDRDTAREKAWADRESQTNKLEKEYEKNGNRDAQIDEKIGKEYERLEGEVEEATRKILVDKYGEEYVNKMEKSQDRANTALATVAVIGGWSYVKI